MKLIAEILSILKPFEEIQNYALNDSNTLSVVIPFVNILEDTLRELNDKFKEKYLNDIFDKELHDSL